MRRYVTGIRAHEESVQRRTKRLQESARFYTREALAALEGPDVDAFLEATERARQAGETLREHLVGRRKREAA